MSDFSFDSTAKLKLIPDAKPDDNALINQLARDMVAQPLLKLDAAPDSSAARMGIAAANGLLHLPEGVWHSVVHNVEHPLEALGTVGMGVGLGLVLKTVLPKSGWAGKIAGAAIGGYFTFKAAEPMLDALGKANRATTLGELDLAGAQMGEAGGSFLVNSVLAYGGYKLGAAGAERFVLSRPGFVEGRANFYDKIETGARNISNVVGITKPKGEGLAPTGYGVVPPYMLEELATRTGNKDFLRTYAQTLEMQQKPGMRFNAIQEAKMPGAREVYDAKGRESLPGERARFEGEKSAGNAEVDAAFDYTGFVRDFYAKEYGRNSIDGKGMKYVSTVNYGQNYENAFWNGSQMTYGRPGPSSPFQTFVLLDIAGHEITHGITEMEAAVQYRGQSGALNESLSDVFGALIKQYAKGQKAVEADWLVGDGIWKPEIKGRALRDMLNPGTAYNDPAVGKDPQPAHMKDYYKTRSDNGGVHYNSGIPNRAFALFAKDVGGYAWEGPGHIWFGARRAAGSNPSFAQFAFHTIEQARAQGFGEHVPKLQKAWESVGVKPSATEIDTSTPGGWGEGDAALKSVLKKKVS